VYWAGVLAGVWQLIKLRFGGWFIRGFN